LTIEAEALIIKPKVLQAYEILVEKTKTAKQLLSGCIYQKKVTKNGKDYGPYWYIKKYVNGKREDRYIGKTIPFHFKTEKRKTIDLETVKEVEQQYEKILQLQYRLKKLIERFSKNVAGISDILDVEEEKELEDYFMEVEA